MKNTLLYIFLTGMAMFSASCSEDAIEADIQNVATPFVPSADDQSEEANIRRSFYNDYGSYLLFSDTLQHYSLGTDVNGDEHYFTEVLDLTYDVGMSTYTNAKYSYTFISDIELKRAAVEYLRSDLMPHLTGSMMPVSWMLVDQIRRDFIGTVSTPYAAVGQRAVVVACRLLPTLTEAQRKQYTARVLNAIIGKLANDHADQFSDFLAVSASFYDGTFTDPKTTAANTAILAEAGFICRGQNDLGSDQNGIYPSRELDINVFARQAIATTPEAFQAKYAASPLVLRKFELMRQTLLALGYVE